MLLQETTPDTSAFMIAGYAVFSVIMALYLTSLLIRTRSLQRDLGTLETMQADNKATEGRARGPRRTGRSAPAAPPKTGRRKRGRKKVTARK
jgi:hypothetical protein